MRKSVLYFFSIGFVSLVAYLLSINFFQGLDGFNFSFLFDLPENSGREGGVSSIIIGTVVIWGLSMLVSSFIGILAAIATYELSYINSFLNTLVIALVFLLAGVPSVVFGLLGNELFVVRAGFGYSILSGVGTISLMMIPLVCLSVYLGLRQISKNLFRSTVSMNISKWKTYSIILLPKLRPAILTGLLLASGRILAETAALLFTSGYSDRAPASIMDSSRTLTIHIYDLMANVAGGEKNAYITSVVLFGLILILNLMLKKIVYLRGGTNG